jgi:uncharacterized phiE125 gp8 family phage protein
MLSLVTAPAFEPITLQEAKDALRVTSTTDDAMMDALVMARRQWAEGYTGRRFVSQVWDYSLDEFPCGTREIVLPFAPLLSVTSISYVDVNGTTQTMSAADYTVATPVGPHCAPGFLYLAYSAFWPSTRCIQNAVTIRFTCGYGVGRSHVPNAIKTAIMLAIEADYDRAKDAERMLAAAEALLFPYKTFAASR